MRSISQRQDTRLPTRLEPPCRLRVQSVLISSYEVLPDFGYGMPKNIPLADVQDPTKSRQLADSSSLATRTITTSKHRWKSWSPTTLANFAAEWKAAGANIADLPAETQKYIQKAAAFLTQKEKMTWLI